MKKQRYLALDVMRGATLAMMILVNTPGSWSHVYSPLLHADWHGATLTDFVFPFFLFIVGASLFFSTKGLIDLTFYQRSQKIIRRTVLLFIMGVGLNAFPFMEPLENLRIMGVLQRIALAYGLAAFICMLQPKVRWLISAGILLLYWALFGFTGSPYSLEDNLVRQWDLKLLGHTHLWQGKGIAFDPEGLLSTLPAVVNVLIGFELTRLLLSQDKPIKVFSKLAVMSVGLIVIALVWQFWVPINKSLWTGSFVLLTSGVAGVVLLTLVLLERWQKLLWLYKGFSILGQNPLFIYVLSWLWVGSYYLMDVNGIDFYQWLYLMLNGVLSANNASLLFAILHVILFWLIAYLLHKKHITISL